MAQDRVFAAIASLPNRKEVMIHSPRAAAVKQCMSDFVEATSKEENKERFACFSFELVKLLNTTLEIPKPMVSAKRRERLWVTYGKLRAKELPTLWKEFLQEICCDSIKEPLFMELVNETLLESMAKDMYTIPECEEDTPHMYLTKDEENILRYACGYVGMKLHERFVKQPGEKAASFVECIDHMHAVGSTSSFLQYTREWIDKVDRGGLFDVSDEAYRLFVAIELAMRDKLTRHLQSLPPGNSEERKQAIIDYVISDCDVQFHWSILSVDIPDERDGLELLQHVIKLWLTIRGFSISKAWMEDYKNLSHTTTKGKKESQKRFKAKDRNCTSL